MSETTTLSPLDEAAFQMWLRKYQAAPGVANADDPASRYDMRGFWNDKAALSAWKPGEHFPDTYKQHGHESFSQESKYSKGPWDGGMWVGEPAETFLAQPQMAPSHVRSGILNLLRK